MADAQTAPREAYQVVSVSDDPETASLWLSRSCDLHRSLRPQLPDDYLAYLQTMFREGANMGALHVDSVVKALAVYRCHHTTFHGLRFYLDDLVTDESERSRGYGAAMLAWCEQRAIENGCSAFDLESGVQRSRAHQFYFRQGFKIFAFGFTKEL
jgi:GNAT superfamily N-acetyltransferase